MALNLKNPKALAAVDELSELTGEGKSEAVATAVEERLARLLAEREATRETPAVRLARVRALVEDCAPRFSAAGAGGDSAGRFPHLTAVLYDESGMPA